MVEKPTIHHLLNDREGFSHRCHSVQGLYGIHLAEHSTPCDVGSVQSMHRMTAEFVIVS